MKKLFSVFLFSVFILSGCSYFSSWNPWNEEGEAYSEQNINQYLWQAALDKLAFMPLQLKDMKEGRIVTDWYSVAGYNGEKFKLDIRIMSEHLRTDCLKVEGYSRKNVNGKWEDMPMNLSLLSAIKISILEKARILYQKSLNN